MGLKDHALQPRTTAAAAAKPSAIARCHRNSCQHYKLRSCVRLTGALGWQIQVNIINSPASSSTDILYNGWHSVAYISVTAVHRDCNDAVWLSTAASHRFVHSLLNVCTRPIASEEL